MNHITGFHHTALRVVDFDRAIKFYQDLGLEIARSWGEAPKRAAMLNVGGCKYIEIFEGGDPEAPSEGRMIHFAFRTADVDAAHAAALEAGAQEKMAPKDVEIPCHQGPLPVRISFVVAPEGEIIEFFLNKST